MATGNFGTLIGWTSEAEYYARGIWVLRKLRSGAIVRYGSVADFAAEWSSGAYGLSWRDTPTGKNLLDFHTH
jgi:hypothetical protein